MTRDGFRPALRVERASRLSQVRPHLRAALAAIVLASFSAIVAAPQAHAQAAPNKLDFAGSVTWLGQVPIMVAVDRGFFKEEGLDVDYKVILSSVDRVMSVTSGAVSFSNLGRGTVLAQIARGNDSFYWFANIDQAPGNEGCYARPGYDSFVALKGKKIAANTSSEFTMDGLLKGAGLTRRDISFVDLPPNEMLAALTKGDVDAVCVWNPFLANASTAVPGGKLLGTDKDTESFRRTGTVASADLMIVSRVLVDKHPEQARKLARAIFRGVEFTNKSPEETARTVAHYFKQSPEEVLAGMKTFEYPGLQDLQKHIQGQEAHMKEYAQWLLDTRKISSLPDIESAKNTTFLPKP